MLSDSQLDRVRASRDALIGRWRAVPAGESLDLLFDPAAGDAPLPE